MTKKRKTASGWTWSSNESHTASSFEHQSTVVPSLEHLTAGTNEALQNGAYNEAISRSSQLIDTLLKRTTGILKLRYSVWNKKMNFTEQLQDALRVTKLDPFDVDGYIFTADVYASQGKQQHAIDILQKAMDIPMTSEQRSFIQHQIHVTKQRLEQHVDFIIDSPHDIFSSIVQHIDGDTAMTCIKVSHAWRNRLLGSHIPWCAAGAVVKANDGVLKASSTYKILPLISRYVESLSVYNLNIGKTIQCIDLIRTHLFSCLQKLYIYRDASRLSDEPYDLSTCIFNALPYISFTLTHLDIEEENSTIISLGCILMICRNLTVLRCNVCSIPDCYGDGVPIFHTTALNEVVLKSCATAMTNVTHLIQASPKLQILELENYEGDILPDIQNHCPRLASVLINRSTFHDFDVYSVTGPKDLKPDAAKLQKLALSGVRSAQPLLPHFQRGTDLLSTLFLEPKCEGTTLMDWQPLSSFTFPKLFNLIVNGTHASNALFECVTGMLHRCPSLENFKLICHQRNDLNLENSNSMETTNRLLDALSNLDKLQSELEFERFDLRGDSFIRLMQRYTTMNGRTLRTLSIKDCKGMTASVLRTIGRIQGLEELWIDGLEEQVTVSDVVEFASLVGQMTTLSVLALHNVKFNDEAAYSISQSKSIKLARVIIPDTLGITEDGKVMLRHRFGIGLSCLR